VYVLLLRQFAADADIVIDAAGLLTGSERSRILEIGRGEAHDLPEDPCIHSMFRAQAIRTPGRIALEYNGRTVTYHDLHTASNSFSRELSDVHGIRPGEVVALVMPQGDRLVSMILAVLMTGAAVLPVDPALPVMRIRYMLQDSGSSHVIVSEEDAHLVPSGIKMIDADMMADERIREEPSVVTDAGSRAYCMYTSGSTGEPKGTFNQHIGFTNMVLSHIRTMGISEDDRVVQFATPSFDVSLFEMFIALYSGATLVIPGKIDLSVLPSFIVEKRVSVAMMTPMVIGTLETDALFPLRVLMTGGEEARPSDAMRLADRLAFYNTYGPTEASVWSTIHRIRSGYDGRKIPIGRPVQNTTLYILDPRMNLLPQGLTGELYIGGAGVGLGYHGKEGLTAERFIPDPFEPGGRLYKTGDLAFWNEDGDLCFIGRKDTQVKVMGYRIELGEVNAAIERLPAVLQAEVIPRRRSGMESMLVAFVVTENDDRDIDDITMRDRLSQSLPVYMLPVRTHRISRMPLTHNGKVDRIALEKIDEEKLLWQEKELARTGIQHPRTATERDLAKIWAALLGTGVIGANDSFFSLGGNSLQLIRLMLLINERWGITSDISRIYTHITLRSMSILIEEQQNARMNSEGIPTVLLPIPAWDPLNGWPVYVMVGGAGSPEEFTKYHRIGEHIGEDFKLLIMPDPAGMESLFPQMPVGELARKYAQMILARQPEGPYILMGDCIGGIDAYATACEIERMTGEKVRVIMMDTSAPLKHGHQDATPHGLLQYYNRFTETPASNEWSFHIFLRALKIPGFRKLFHRTPESRKQAERLAIAYGLFDPEWYRKTYLSTSDIAEDPFAHYIREGWKRHFMPSPCFNPYRYRKNNDGFSISDDNPVLHALFIGMRQRYVRNRIDHGRLPRARRSDIMSARTFLRREQFLPLTFGGDVDLIVSAKIHARNPMMGWDHYVSGRLRSYRTEGDHRSYLKEQLSVTAALLSGILGVKKQLA
jgi:amino acid adenylation domain-containing protein